MGWANCGDDSKGRPIGYAHDATCDFPGCATEIHRGLAYACGGDHGETEWSCESYFCETHRANCLPDTNGAVCASCYATAKSYAIENPQDSAELIAHFVDWEGEDWSSPQVGEALADAAQTPTPPTAPPPS